MPIRHARVEQTNVGYAIQNIHKRLGISYFPSATLHIDEPTDSVNSNISLVLSMNNCPPGWYRLIDEMFYVGEVVDIITQLSVRIMSDVWADLTFAVVYEPSDDISENTLCDTKDDSARKKPHMFRRIQIGNSEFPDGLVELRRAAIDAPEWLLDVYQGAKAGTKFLEAEADYDQFHRVIQNNGRMVKKGSIVRVVRGNKITKGTEGLVFWAGDSNWGLKVGIAIPLKDGSYRMVERQGKKGRMYKSYEDVEWTYSKNVECIRGYGLPAF